MASVVCIMMKYQDEAVHAMGATATKDTAHNQLVIKNQAGAITGEINLDKIESWWHEAELPEIIQA